MTYLRMTRGDDRVLTVTASEDLTGTTVRFTARRRKSDDEAVIAKMSPDDITISTVTAAVAINAEDTRDLDPVVLFWDVEVTDATDKVHTVAAGRLSVVEDVTRLTES